MANFKISDTGENLRIMVGNSLLTLSYKGARMLANTINAALENRKEKKE